MEDHSRRIVVIRHARAEQVGPTDFERQLTDRGRADAAELGGWLSGQGVVADRALVSAALRTRETWTAVADAAGWGAQPDLDEGLYTAGPETALDIVRGAPDGSRSLVVIGHNPTVGHLVQLLDDGEGDPQATTEMAMGYPTCAATVFSYDGAWAALGEQTARVVSFHVGRS